MFSSISHATDSTSEYCSGNLETKWRQRFSRTQTIYPQKVNAFGVYSFYNSDGDVNLDVVKEILADNKQVKPDFDDYMKT